MSWKPLVASICAAILLISCGGNDALDDETEDTAETPAAQETQTTETPAAEETQAESSAEPQARGQTVELASGALQLSIPENWSHKDAAFDIKDDTGIVFGRDGGVGPGVVISAEPESWNPFGDEPGVFIGLSRPLATRLELSGRDFSGLLLGLAAWHGRLKAPDQDCTRSGASNFEHSEGRYEGFTTFWLNCGGPGTRLLDVAAAPSDGAFVIVAQGGGSSEADVENVQRILSSIAVKPERLP